MKRCPPPISILATNIPFLKIPTRTNSRVPFCGWFVIAQLSVSVFPGISLPSFCVLYKWMHTDTQFHISLFSIYSTNHPHFHIVGFLYVSFLKVLEIEPKSSHVLGKHLPLNLYLSPFHFQDSVLLSCPRCHWIYNAPTSASQIPELPHQTYLHFNKI